ncbi:MAG: hypothetical protein AB3N28_11210 [Kordiimonas sp.]
MDDTLLKRALRANAIFSTICASIIYILTSQLSALFNDFPELYLQILGGGLYVFAAQLFWVASKSPIDTKAAKAITWMDWGWVAGSGVLIIATANQLTMLAIDIILGVAIVVGICAYTQGRGLKKLADPGETQALKKV